MNLNDNFYEREESLEEQPKNENHFIKCKINEKYRRNKDDNNCLNQVDQENISQSKAQNNHNFINNLNDEEENNTNDDNLLISFSNISDINKTNNNINNSMNCQNNSNKLQSPSSYFALTSNSNGKMSDNNNNTYNNDIKKRNLNYIFNILNNENNSILKKEDKNNNHDNSFQFNFSNTINNINNNKNDIQFKNSNGKKQANFVIENTKNLNIINNNKTEDTYQMENLKNIQINNQDNKNKEKENIDSYNAMNKSIPKHLSNFSFVINNFNIIQSNKNSNNNNSNEEINFEITKNDLDEKINIGDLFFHKFKENRNNINKIKDYKITKIDLSDINDSINNTNKKKDNKYIDLKKEQGFPSFSIIDNFQKLVNPKKKQSVSANKNSKNNRSYLDNKKLIKKGNTSCQKKLNKQNFLPLNKYIFTNDTDINTDKIKETKIKKDEKNNKYKFNNKNKLYNNIMIQKSKNNSREKNKDKVIDQTLKERIQSILGKNINFILFKNLLNSNRNYNIHYKSENHHYSKNNSKNNSPKRKFSANNNSLNKEGKKDILIRINGRKIDNKFKSNLKNILKNKKPNFSQKKKFNQFNNKIMLDKNSDKTNMDRIKPLEEKNYIYYNDFSTHNINFSNTINVESEGKTYIIEDKDINIFSLGGDSPSAENNPINIENYNNLNKCYGKNKDSEDIEKINNSLNSLSINKSISNKHKFPSYVINNFSKYKRKKD